MKRWNVIVELPAQEDVAEARLWIAEYDVEAANRWFDSIYDTIGSLELFPERCSLAPESKFLNREI
jgi:plasmid stabilization system protein ParE